jgi:hypothetical protein
MKPLTAILSLAIFGIALSSAFTTASASRMDGNHDVVLDFGSWSRP